MIDLKRRIKRVSHRLSANLKRPLTILPPFAALCFKYVGELGEFGRWLQSRSSKQLPKFSQKYDLFRHIASTYLQDNPIDYLEFGVYKGNTLRTWCSLNDRPESRFWGFDCFTGLPEDWNFPTGTLKKGTYNAGGTPPTIDDRRVRFVKGLFQDTLSGFLKSFVPVNRLVIHLDADLHSSTLYVLATLDSYLKPGTLLVLDDFATVTDVFRAVADYLRAFRKDCRLLASAGPFYDIAVVEIVGLSLIT
jgi:O-methyltransferase